MTETYRIPSGIYRVETEVLKSRFIATIGHADTVDTAKAFIASIRAEMPDASHHVYAFRVGHGNSVIDGLSDDGEPSGTSGPPIMAVLRGSGLGDVVIVVTRYFGGKLLGTGGLVRAYSEAAQLALSGLATELKIERQLLGVELDYSHFTLFKRLLPNFEAEIEDESFTDKIALLIRMPIAHVKSFKTAVIELTAGQSEPFLLD